MAVLASSVITRVRTQLVDNLAGGAPYRWSDSELLSWLSDGQRTIVSAIPRASSVVTNVVLVSGTRQTLPADAFQLITVVRNMGAGGATPGQSLQRVSRDLMDNQYPNWPAETPTASAKVFLYDLSDPTVFHVYPPSNAANTVEVIYSMQTPELTALTDPLVVKDIYTPALFDYVMFRAHAKDSDYAAGAQLAAGYMTSFTAYLSALQKDDPTNLSLVGRT